MNLSAGSLLVFSEKSDVSEEITRIHSHLDQFEDSCKRTVPIGRKLEFIVQELEENLIPLVPSL